MKECDKVKKVSIIIPAYNCEKTLAECLGNLVHQTLQDIEIIIVNDCSTDNTMQIILDCEAQFPELIIAVNSDKNRGPGGARNIGLQYASGEYIGFVDSDDIVTIDMYEKMYAKAKTDDYDIVDCAYFDDKKDAAVLHTSDELSGILDSHKRSELIVGGGYIWSKIFRHEFLRSSGITFRENAILEDSEYIIYLLATARNITNVSELLYRYRNFDTSASKYINAARYFNNSTAAITAIYNRLSVLPNYSELQKAVEYPMFQLCSYCTNLCVTYVQKEKNFNVLKSLDIITSLIKQYIKIPYRENQYILNKIDKADLDIMRKLKVIR